MNTKTTILILLSTIFLGSCASICKVPPKKTTINGKTIEFGESKMPCNKVSDFNTAVDLTIKAIFSNEFEKRLENYIKDSIDTGEHAKAWENLNALDIVKKMREQLNGTYAETYGGIKGLWLFIFSHNIAYDGTENGPILLNRIPLKNRTPSSIANTIAHEVSHRIGLTHPHSSVRGKFKVALKEPAYIVGDIIEDIVTEKNITNQ